MSVLQHQQTDRHLQCYKPSICILNSLQVQQDRDVAGCAVTTQAYGQMSPGLHQQGLSCHATI